MIELVRVRKHYAGAPALEDVSFHVRAGELALITGPSGAGKTTLLRLLYLAERADDGTVSIAGREVTRLRASSLPYLRRNVGVVFQDFKLLRGRSALDNVRVPLEILGLPRVQVEARARLALARVGLADRAGVACARLSGGEQQRVALARALVARPAILLADEPTGNLDVETAQGILDLLATANAAGTTVVVATHDPAVIAWGARRGARRVQLVRGRVQGTGAVVQLTTINGERE
ncbi:MAG TPA: ATP-binding cassette domain-containing protein [Polyangia bacterium]|nr:ATP-binding cassette domain-containing protein [Polyangia bacterium]